VRSRVFDDVVEVFDLADLDTRLTFGIVAFDCRCVGTTLSIVIFSGVPFHLIALRRNRSAALRSR
jgi:hypothetical protein